MATSESVFGAPPPVSLDITPTEDDVASFRHDGYLRVEQLTSPEEAVWLKEVVGEIMAAGKSYLFEPGAALDKKPPFRLTQALSPEVQYPELLDTTYVRNVRRFGAALLGVPVEALTAWGYALRMPPGGTEVGWHQDEAYWLPEVDYHAVTAWLPLTDPGPEPAIEYLPGSHRRGLVTHRHEGVVKSSLLRADDVVDDHAVAVDVPIGGAAFHDPRTLLRVRSRTGATPYDAYPVCVQGAPRRRRRRRRWPWVDELRAEAGPPPDPLTYVADGRIAVIG